MDSTRQLSSANRGLARPVQTKRSIHSPFFHMDSTGQPSSESRRHVAFNSSPYNQPSPCPSPSPRTRTYAPTNDRPSVRPGTVTAAEEKGRRQKQAQTTNPSVHGRTDEHTTQSRSRCNGQGQSNGINFCLAGFPTLPRQRCSVPCKVSLLFASRRNCGVPHYF